MDDKGLAQSHTMRLWQSKKLNSDLPSPRLVPKPVDHASSLVWERISLGQHDQMGLTKLLRQLSPCSFPVKMLSIPLEGSSICHRFPTGHGQSAVTLAFLRYSLPSYRLAYLSKSDLPPRIQCTTTQDPLDQADGSSATESPSSWPTVFRL